MILWTQPLKLVQWRLVSAPLLIVCTTSTEPAGGAEMSTGVSPRLLPTTLMSFVGLTTLTLTAPPVGAGLFTYLATVDLFTSQFAPWGITNEPGPVVPEMSSWASMSD